MQHPQHPEEGTLVRFRERGTGEIRVELVPAEVPLRWFYETRLGRMAGVPVFGLRLASRLAGWWQRSRWSSRQIAPFAARFGVDMEEAEIPPGGFTSFNSFFIRRLRPGTRPFAPDPRTLCAPADGRMLVFPHLGDGADFPLKGAHVRPDMLLAGAAPPHPWSGGAALVVRLAPADYHRFHFCDDGTAGPPCRVRGRLHSVNPIALQRFPRLLAANQRSITALHSEHFGPIMQVEVGAFAVGSIVHTFLPGRVTRGQEKGFFQFGGSSVVLLFTAATVTFDADLVQDSAAGLEVRIRAGEPIGRAGTG